MVKDYNFSKPRVTDSLLQLYLALSLAEVEIEI